MASIHPKAIIDPAAVLGEGTTIGPFAIVGAGVRCGKDCQIGAHTILQGRVEIGDANRIGHGCIFGSPALVHPGQTSDGSLLIGNRNVFREHVTIHSGETPEKATRVGNENIFLVGVHLAGSARVEDRVLLGARVQVGMRSHVETGAVLGGGCILYDRLRLGKLAYVRGGGAWSRDIPPFTLGAKPNELAGINAPEMRRQGFDAAARSEIRRAYNLLFRSGLSMQQAIERAKKMVWGPDATHFFEFVQAESSRGVCPGRRGPEGPVD